MSSVTSLRIAFALVAIGIQIVISAPTCAQGGWQLSRNVEIIAGSGPGGAQDDMKKNYWTGDHLRSREAAAYMDAQYQELKAILGELLARP